MKNSLDEDTTTNAGLDVKKRRKMNEEFCAEKLVESKNHSLGNDRNSTANSWAKLKFEPENAGRHLASEGRVRTDDEQATDSDVDPPLNSASPAPMVENISQDGEQSTSAGLTMKTEISENIAFSSKNIEKSENCPVLILNESLNENQIFSVSPSMEIAQDAAESADENWTTDSEAIDEDVQNEESDEDDKTDLTSTQPSSRRNFSFVRSVQNRQYGFSGTRKNSSLSHKLGSERKVCDPRTYERSFLDSVRLVQKMKLSKKLEFHHGCVNCLHFNSDGSRLASGSDDLRLCIWDWARGKPLTNFKSGHRSNVFQAKFMPLSGDCHVVTCSRDGQVRLADLSACSRESRGTRLLAQHKGAAHKLALLNDSPHTFLTCGEDGVVFEIDLRDQTPNKLLVVKNMAGKSRIVPLYSIHANPTNQNLFAVCGRDNFCYVYDRRFVGTAGSFEPFQKFSPAHLTKSDTQNSSVYGDANVTSLVYNHNGMELLASYNDDDIYLFDTKSTSENSDSVLHRYTGHRNNATIKGVNFYGPNSEFVVSGSDCGHIYFWDRQTEQVVNFLQADDNGAVNVLEAHPSCAVLATSGLDNEVKIWEPLDDRAELDLKILRKLIKTNARYREADRTDQGSLFDAHMLQLMISRMRRATRQSNRQQVGVESAGRAASAEDDDGIVESPTSGEDGDEDDGDQWGDSQVDDEDDTDDEDGDEDGAPLRTCRTS